MSLPNPASSPKLSRFVAQAGAGLVCALGAIALLGWLLNLDALRCIVPGSTPLKPNIAAGFFLIGVVLMLLCRKELPKPARLFAQLVSLIVAALGALTLSQYLFNWDLGIDRWLISTFPSSMGLTNPGRMQPTTAFCFLLAGCALIAKLQHGPWPLVLPITVGLSGTLVIVGVTSLTGFFLEKLFGPQLNLLGMSVSGITAAVGFLFLGAGLLALLRSGGELKWWVDGVTSI
jgi:hypothetical protein